MNKFIVTVGCPGSGKSTWADEYCATRPYVLRLERDKFREAIFGSRQAYQEHPLHYSNKSRVVTPAMLGALRAGYHWYKEVLLSDTGIHWRNVEPFYNELRIQPTVKLFDLSLKTLLERNSKRPEEHKVPESVIQNFYADMQTPGNQWWKGW